MNISRAKSLAARFAEGDNVTLRADEAREYHKLFLDVLREREQKRYTTYGVAVILAEFTGDDCACDFNGIDEWLPERCELQDACPHPVGVACWEQYLKYREYEPPKEGTR